MNIYGIKTKAVSIEKVQNSFASCGFENSTQITIVQRYLHIFWIPFLSIGKTGLSQCSHCKEVLYKKEFTEKLNTNFQELKAKTKLPIWTFTGLAIFSLLVISGIIFRNINNEDNYKLISNPKIGDIYEIKIEMGRYSLWRLADMRGEIVYILENQFETDRIKGLKGIKEKGIDVYHEAPLILTKTELVQLFKSGKIIDIERKKATWSKRIK